MESAPKQEHFPKLLHLLSELMRTVLDGRSCARSWAEWFSPLQLRLITAAVVAVAAAVLVVVIALAVWALAALIHAFRAILLPMAIAGEAVERDDDGGTIEPI